MARSVSRCPPCAAGSTSQAPSAGPQHVARPQVPVQSSGRLRRPGQRRQPIADPLDRGRLGPGQVAGVAGPAQVGQQPVGGVPRSPGRILPVRRRRVPHRRPPDPGLRRAARRAGPERRRPGRVQGGQPPAELGRGGRRRLRGLDELGDQQARLLVEHRGHRGPAGNPQPAQPGRLGRDRRRHPLLDQHRPPVGQLDPGRAAAHRPAAAPATPGPIRRPIHPSLRSLGAGAVTPFARKLAAPFIARGRAPSRAAPASPPRPGRARR